MSIPRKLKLSGQLVAKNSYAEFHENSTVGLVVDTRSQTKGRT